MLILCLFNDVELSCRGNAAKDLRKEVEIKRGQTDFDGALTSFCPKVSFAVQKLNWASKTLAIEKLM